VARYEAGAETLQLAPLALPPLADGTLAVLAPELERKRLDVTTNFPADLPPVLADADRLTEILLNLLDNAITHTPAGGRISVKAALDGQYVRVTISDSGPGIAEEERERVFERFYRADPSRATATGGNGLGLAIVRALVEAHGGTVAVDESTEGGARFNCTLPIAPTP
jgi:signal transduction histidine kinase